MARGEIFNFVKLPKIKKSVFDLSHENKLSLNMGDLVPVLCTEVIPGDRFKVNATAMLRFAPMLAPIMHRVDMTIHYFFVPNRLLWDKWEEFITGGADGTAQPAFPRFKPSDTSFVSGSLADYLGVPAATKGEVSLMMFKAYGKVWNDYYRDQNLMEEINLHTDQEGYVNISSPAYSPLLQLRKRCWEKDYFTSCLPWAQRGPEVSLPLGTRADVKGDFHVTGVDGEHIESGDNVLVYNTLPGGKSVLFADESGQELQAGQYTDPSGGQHGLYADLSQATGITLNALRLLERLQYWLEANARGGGRYVEQILMHFGTVSPDARLQRAEYLGGGKVPVQISEVLQTAGAQEDGTTQATAAGVGQMYGHGMSVGNMGFKKKFTEHGIILGILSVMPRTAYQQGLHKMWRRFDKLDYAFPEFAHLGEQEVMTWEVFAGEEKSIFGYQSRYAEYKYLADEVHGDFRGNLSFWHLGRIFNNAPTLNKDFVTSDPRTDIFAVTDEQVQHLWCDIWFDIKAIRPLPKFSTPMLGH